jgi:hypothetical protein
MIIYKTTVLVALSFLGAVLIQKNIESILPGKQEDLVIKLQVWLMEGEVMTIKVILQLVVELSLKGMFERGDVVN